MVISRKATAVYVLLASLASLISVFPMYWVVSTSFKRPVDVFRFPPKLVFTPTLENYRSVLGSQFGAYFMHSVLISVGALIISLVVGVPAAYALSRSQMKHKEGIDFFILATRMAPPIVLLLPFYALWAHFRLIDTYQGMIAVYVSFNLAFVIWMMRASFDSVGRELDEAASIDGCNRWGAFLRVVLPNARGALIATVILTLLLTWNEFLYALVLTSSNTETMPVAVAGYVGFDKINWGGLSAAATIIVAPVLIFALMVQKYLMRGLVGVAAINADRPRFAGRRVIVTGGGSGIGRATGEALVKEGAKVALGDLDVERLRRVTSDLGDPESVFGLAVDVASEDSSRDFVSKAVEQLSGLDVLINCAGVGGVGPPRPLAELPIDAWRKTIDTNLTGTYLITRFALPHMTSGGAIVNLASTYAIVGGPMLGAYSASKGGIVQLTRTVAVDYAHAGIRANAIAPGFVDTPMLRADIDKTPNPAATLNEILQRIPQGRLMGSDEVARAVLFLASEDAAIITGSLLCADGGFTAL